MYHSTGKSALRMHDTLHRNATAIDRWALAQALTAPCILAPPLRMKVAFGWELDMQPTGHPRKQF